MKVVQVTSSAPPRTGGVEEHIYQLSRGLNERGHEVEVLAADGGSEVPTLDHWNGVTVRRIRSLAPSGRYHLAPGIVPAIRRADADVVHAHNYHSLPLLLAAIAVGDEQFVATPHYHGASASHRRDWLLRRYQSLGQWALARADAILAVSEWERDQLRNDLLVEAKVIPNGVDTNRFRNASEEAWERPYLLCVGRLEAYKGVEHAITALSDLPDFDLLVAGEGDDRDRLEAIANRHSVGDRVKFLGFVPDERLSGLYAGAEAVLALSKFESYGMTVAEALAAGTPCVVRSTGALSAWANRDDCVAVNPETVAEGVIRARELAAPSEPLPTWDDTVAAVEAVYTAGHHSAGGAAT